MPIFKHISINIKTKVFRKSIKHKFKNSFEQTLAIGILKHKESF